MLKQLCVKEIWQIDAKTLGILWTDGKESRYDVYSLRMNCPCASCIDEVSGEKTLQEADVPKDTVPKVIRSVGQYALTIQFSDGHETGIYTFEYLRKFG